MNHNTFIQDTKNLLCPPGMGVYTIHTASEKKNILFQEIFKTTENIQSLWETSINEISEFKCGILGISSDTGGGILRGANWGPLFLRLALLEHAKDSYKNTKDFGDVRVIPHLLHDKYVNTETLKSCRKSLYKDEQSMYPVSPLSIAQYFCDQYYLHFPEKSLFSIGGDHSCSFPVVSSYLKSKKKRGIKAALIHFDAHTDLLTERLGIDICFGSWTAHVLDDLSSPSHCIQIGIRSSGKNKEHWEKTFGVKQFWAKEIMQEGAFEIAQKIITSLKKDHIEELYISFDIDALDALYAPATGTPEAEGLSPFESILIIEQLAKHFPITGADMMELAPFVRNEFNQDSSTKDTTFLVASQISGKLLNALSKGV